MAIAILHPGSSTGLALTKARLKFANNSKCERGKRVYSALQNQTYAHNFCEITITLAK